MTMNALVFHSFTFYCFEGCYYRNSLIWILNIILYWVFIVEHYCIAVNLPDSLRKLNLFTTSQACSEHHKLNTPYYVNGLIIIFSLHFILKVPWG